MAKSGPRGRGRPAGSEHGVARTALIDAAITTIRDEGFVGTSARAIAGRAGVNSAAVFYHFGSVNELLLAALDATSGERLARYREACDGVTDLGELVRITSRLNRDDYESGHIAVMAALVGGGAAIPGLAQAIAERMRPWIDVVVEVIERVAAVNPVLQRLDATVVARALVSLFLGVELLAQLEGDRGPGMAMFDQADRMLVELAPLLVLLGAAR